MLPRFQRVSQDGANSLSLSASFTCLNPPRYYEDLLSSVDTDRTITVDDRTATRPPSPAPLIFVSVPLPAAAVAKKRIAEEVVGLVRSPARTGARLDVAPKTNTAAEGYPAMVSEGERMSSETASCGAARYAAFSSHSSSSSSRGGSDSDAEDDSIQFDCTTISNTSCDTAVSAATRAAAWGVLWMHIFPRHIAGYLTVRDVVEVALVCRGAQEAARHPWVWRSLALCHYAINPGSVERVFHSAAHQWSLEGEGQRSPRLRVCEYLPESPRSARGSDAAHAAPHAQQPAAEWGVLTASTSTTPWLGRQHNDSHLSSEDDAVEVSDSEEDADADTLFNAHQPPQLACEEDNATLLAALLNGERADTGETRTPRPAAARVAATPAGPLPGSRYLWQAAAAAMPSPSSPVASPLPEEDVVDGVVSLHHDADTAATTPSSLARIAGVEAVGPNADSSRCACHGALTRDPSPSASVALPAASAAPSAVSPPCAAAAAAAAAPGCVGERAVRVVSTPAEASSASAATELKGGEKRFAVHEQLPPPSPAQLDCCPTSNNLHHGRAVTDDQSDAAAQSVSFSSSVFHQRPSFTLEVATDVTVTSADGVVLSQAVSGTPPPAAAAAAAAAAVAVPTHYYTLCRATAERSLLKSKPAFPWQAFTRYLHTNRVHTSLARCVALSQQAREALCRGAWASAYGSVSHVIHSLLQAGSCRGVEHLVHLAQALVRRASLSRHRGHVHPLAAFTDLCTAALLCPDSVAASDVAELAAREELPASLSPDAWLQAYEAAARVASPVALLGTVSQVPFLFPQHRTLCFCSALVAYMHAARLLGQSLTHLLVRAGEWATPGTGEELLVRALRETSTARQTQHRAHARKACATADYALSLMPLATRTAADVLSAAWVRDCFGSKWAVHETGMLRWPAEAPEAVAYARATPLDARWLAWLSVEVHIFVHKEMTEKTPSRSVVTGVALSLTRHDCADGLVRIAAQYADYDIRAEDLYPPLPQGSSRRRVTQQLLHHALSLRPLHPTAALLLSRVYAAAEEDVPMASAVLTDCIHRWAKRFDLLSLDCRTAAPAAAGARCGLSVALSPSDTGATAVPPSTTYLHRRERSPEVCFIPAELLVGRNRCLHTVADLAEATEQHPSLSYPYQMRAAMAMDRGYCLAAVLEMGRIVGLSLDASDVALRVRFLQDAVDMPALRPPHSTDETVSTTVPSLSLVTSTESPPAASASLTPEPPHVMESPSQQLLLPLYRAWLSRMSGLLALLRPPELPLAGGGEDGDGLSTSFCGGQSCSRFFSRELPSTASRELGGGHVSRVASLAVSEADGEGVLLSGRAGAPTRHGGVDAASIQAFLDDLVGVAGRT